MSRDILTNKWLIGGIVMLLIVAGACYLWYQHDIAPYKQEAAEAEKLLHQSKETKQVSKTGNKAEQATENPLSLKNQNAKFDNKPLIC